MTAVGRAQSFPVMYLSWGSRNIVTFHDFISQVVERSFPHIPISNRIEHKSEVI
jgi:hypothetical protein